MLDILQRASVEGAALVALVWIATRALPRLSPSARAVLWWCAAAKFVVALIWVIHVDIPILRAPRAVQASTAVAISSAAVTPGAPAGAASQPAEHTPARGTVDLTSALIAGWAFGAAVMVAALALRSRRTIGIATRAAAAPRGVQATAEDLAARLDLCRAPIVRISCEIATPLTSGFFRPTVVVPARFTDLTPPHQEMALCHELMHIRRGDLWIGTVPAIAERLFFFHPLAHLAAREYGFWRESACDAAVLEVLHAAPREYGQLLLDLGVAPRASLAAAGAPWSFSNLKRRIHMLGDLPRASRLTRFAGAAAVLLALCAAAPLRLVARAPVPSAVRDEQQPDRAPEISKPTASAASAAAPAAPAAPQQPAERQFATREPTYVLFLAGERAQASGSHADIERARTFRKGDEPLLWFRTGAGEFVVRDPEVIRSLQAIWEPVVRMGVEQGRLGGRQGELGAQMARIGSRQASVGAEQGRLGTRQGELGARQVQLAMQDWNATEARRQELEKARESIDREMRALDDEMKGLNARMREFEQPMRQLGSRMDAIGSEMRALGRKMEEATERARVQLRDLLDRAVASKAAQPVK